MGISFLRKKNEGENTALWLEDQFNLCDAQRRRIETEWGTNALFLVGNQWEAAAEDMRRFGRIPVPTTVSDKVKLTSNKIVPLARQAAATVADNIAQLIATAATSDQADVYAASISSDYLDSRYTEDNEEEKRRDEVMWAIVAGRVGRMTFWNPDADGFNSYGKLPGAGDVASVTLNPWRFYTSPWCSSTEESPFIILSDVRSTDEIYDIYGIEVESEEVADATKWLDRLVMSIVVGAEMSGNRAPKRNGACLLKRMYCRPTKQYPKGRVWHWVGKTLLLESDLPEGEMPIEFFDWLPVPGRAYPLPFITPLRDLQHEINVTLSQLVALKNRQLRGDVIMSGPGEVTQEYAKEPVAWDKDTGIPTEWRRTGQKIIRVGTNATFQLMEYNLPANEAEVLIGRLWNDMMDAGGIRETSLGNTPPSGTTATQVLALKDSDHQGLAFFRAGFDKRHCKVGRLKLLVARNHYEVPRMIRVVGERQAVKTKDFFGADLRNTEDVRPRPVPIISEAQKLQMMQELATAEFFDFSGTPQQKLNKATALINTGIPGIQEEAEKKLGCTIEELEEACAKLNALDIKAAMLQAEGAVKQIESAVQAQQQEQMQPVEQQQPPTLQEQLMSIAGGAGSQMAPPGQAA